MGFSTLQEQWEGSGILSLDMQYRHLSNRVFFFFQHMERIWFSLMTFWKLQLSLLGSKDYFGQCLKRHYLLILLMSWDYFHTVSSGWKEQTSFPDYTIITKTGQVYEVTFSVLSENWGKHFNPYSIHSYMTLTKGNLELFSSSLHQKPFMAWSPLL